MMNRLSIFLIVLCCSLFSCKSSKKALSPAQIEAFNILVTSNEFIIESDVAYPQVTSAVSQVLNSQLFLANGNNASAINLVGNANFLKVKGDSVFSYLPYFGERQMQVAYGGIDDSAIEFNDVMEDYTIKENKDKSKSISFSANSNNENFNVIIRLFQNRTSEIILNGASRFSIRYEGHVAALEKK